MPSRRIKKILYIISQYFVGILFIFSGLIKLNDPIGTQIKFEEFFHIFSTEFHPAFEYLIPYALGLSVFLCVLEVVLGITLIMSYQIKVTIYALVGIITFFTLLTGYSAVTGKVTDCGCFGDAIKLTPWQSFYKDIILSIFIGILFFFREQKKEKNSIVKHFVASTSLVTCVLIAILCITYLPFIDFRAYHINSNIVEKMRPSAPYIYEYQVTDSLGNKKVFTKYPSQKGYSLDTMIHKNPEARPIITDFAIWDDDNDKTQWLLEGKKGIILIQKRDNVDIKEWEEEIAFHLKNLITETSNKEIKWAVVTSTNKDKILSLLQKQKLNLPIMYGDATLLKAMIRANIGIMIFHEGIVLGKWHSNLLPHSKDILMRYQ